MKRLLRITAFALIAVFCFGALAACVGNKDDAKKRLEKKDYTVVTVPTLGIGGIESIQLAKNGDESVIIFFYKDAKDAKEFMKDKDEAQKKAKSYGLTADGDKTKVKRSGKAVLIGTSKAIRHAGKII